MEIDYTSLCSDSELKIARKVMNSKIDIFQEPNSYVFRSKNIKQNFHNSYEHQIIQNDTAIILSSSSNLLLYSIANGDNDIHKSKYFLKKNFPMTEAYDGKDCFRDMENQYNNLKKRIMMKKLENDEEFKQLCDFINNSKFHQLMTTNTNFAKFILYHKYLEYHSKYEEINKNYLKLLCPAYNEQEN
jgi:hypothetical protein